MTLRELLAAGTLTAILTVSAGVSAQEKPVVWGGNGQARQQTNAPKQKPVIWGGTNGVPGVKPGKARAPIQHTYEIVNVTYRNGMVGGAIKDEQTGKLVPLYGMITQFYKVNRGAGATFLDKALGILRSRGVAKNPIKEANPDYVLAAGEYRAETRNGNLYLNTVGSTQEIIVEKKDVDLLEAFVGREGEAEYWRKGAEEACLKAEQIGNGIDVLTSPGLH